MTLDELYTHARELPEEERIELAHRLLEGTQELPTTTDPGWEAASVAEANARSERFARGETTARDWRDVIRDLRSAPRKEEP